MPRRVSLPGAAELFRPTQEQAAEPEAPPTSLLPEATEATEDEQTPTRPAAGSGEQHQPNTDADIHEAGSLFDL